MLSSAGPSEGFRPARSPPATAPGKMSAPNVPHQSKVDAGPASSTMYPRKPAAQAIPQVVPSAVRVTACLPRKWLFMMASLATVPERARKDVGSTAGEDGLGVLGFHDTALILKQTRVLL